METQHPDSQNLTSYLRILTVHQNETLKTPLKEINNLYTVCIVCMRFVAAKTQLRAVAGYFPLRPWLNDSEF